MSNLEKKYDFYIAAPFFNDEQNARVDLVEKLLEERGLTYFSPRRDSAVADINVEAQRKRVFKLNCDSILKSRGVIAITDGKDVGTIFEAGYAFANGIPITYVAFTLGDAPFNLMLSESGNACKTKEELELAIDGNIIYYQGEIE